MVVAGITTDPEDRLPSGVSSGIMDLSIAMDHMTLKAAEEGLGTCWIGAFDQESAKRALGVPKRCEIVALMPIGYPKEPLRKKENRKSLDEIVSYEGFA